MRLERRVAWIALWLCRGGPLLALPERRVVRRSLPWRMQGLKKRHERRRFRRTQILPVRWHVTASLDHLADELILCKPHGNTVQSRTSLSAQLPKRMAVAALLDLKNERTLALKRSCAVQKSLRHGITAPGIHVRAPGRVAGEMRKCS